VKAVMRERRRTGDRSEAFVEARKPEDEHRWG
jgi:hypothetical protein